MFLRQSTASQEVIFSKFVDSTDGDTSETGLTIANTDIKLYKGGATTSVNKNSGGATHATDGDYSAVFDATDTDTLGNLKATIHVAGALYVEETFTVLSQLVYDSIIAGTDNLQVDSIQISGDASAADNMEATWDGTGYTDDNAPATQAQIGNIATGAGGLSTVAASATVTTGTETLTYTSTNSLNLVYHEIAASAGNTEFYYEFNLGGDGTATDILWNGYVQSNGDSTSVWGYDWVAAGWVQVGTLSGSSGTTQVEESFTFTVSMTGTGTNLGLVRLRFLSTTTTNIATDRVLAQYTVISRTVGYSKGAVWLNTNGSNTSTEDYVDGTADNAVSTIAAANTILASLGLTNLEVSAGSSVTLAASQDQCRMTGENWTLALGGQSVSNSGIYGAIISGTMTAANNTIFQQCIINAVTLPPCTMRSCYWGDTITLGSAGNFYFNDCKSRIAGSSSPVLDMGAAIGASNISIRGYSGGLTINNIAAGDVISLGGPDMGTITLNGADGTVDVRGTGKPIVDNRTGTPVLTTTGHISTENASSLGALSGICVGILDDTSNIQTRLPAALAGDGSIKSSVEAIKGLPDTTNRLEAGLQGVITGVVGVGSTTTNIITSSLSPAGTGTNQFKNKVLTFNLGTTTGALQGTPKAILANTSGATPVFTTAAFEVPPVSGDTFTLT